MQSSGLDKGPDVDRGAAVRLIDEMHRHRRRALPLNPELAARLALPDRRGVTERAFVLHLEAFDWNCPQHITPRCTEAEIVAGTAPLATRLAELEAENAALRAALDGCFEPAASQTRMP